MRLPKIWEDFLSAFFNLPHFYNYLDGFLKGKEFLTPKRELIFNVFNYVKPADVRCVLFGEDPYPRVSSANGVAFWDKEIRSWKDKTNGNALKNILKALLVSEGIAEYATTINECRQIAEQNLIHSPPKLFELWLGQGVLLVNSALTFTSFHDKNTHFALWRPFHLALIAALNSREENPFYILWGNKAQQWEETILKSIDNPRKIIKQGHPTFIHQFLRKDQPDYSPFDEIKDKTGLRWL